MMISLSFFSFDAAAFAFISKKPLPHSSSERFITMFSSNSFKPLTSTFRFFWVDFWIWCEEGDKIFFPYQYLFFPIVSFAIQFTQFLRSEYLTKKKLYLNLCFFHWKLNLKYAQTCYIYTNHKFIFYSFPIIELEKEHP